MTRDSAEVTLTGITKSYGGRTVLDGLDLSMAGGELLALLGPSGCGKTTTLRVLAGLEIPESGTVKIGSKDVTSAPVRGRGIGIVFQAYSLFPHMSALDNVAYGLRIAGASRSRRTLRAKELLEMVGLGEHGAKYPAQLSGGQAQRVALARALAIEPRVLLLDEPLSALDAQVRVHLREEIKRIQTQSGTTTLLVTHDQEEALTIADRVGVMLNGRIEQLGTPEDIYASPRTAFISEFVGAVNRIPALATTGGVAVLGRILQISNPATAPSQASGLEALVRPEDLCLSGHPEGTGIVESMVLRGATTSVMVNHLGAPLRIDLPSHEAAGFFPAQRVAVSPRRDSVLVDSARSDVPQPENTLLGSALLAGAGRAA
ncbi:spermidine/putrescine ABC transporter ATP-binding protein [Arthrobacter sp. AQ5-05]|uniref:ABC transporter ATP-binding protein n=1 Tax=Arthrobacter sp. AQ5-05 TaxID=2184581 RepID=UPI000DCD56CA|nr:ABC transporter ATP-binding protein [Arthrobacter sp. AQ5-05]RAX48280.1 spermidine/putrescine ABC transporter ATP-binding protein [Arthrobacter sp. AQ5-05]